MVELKNVFCSNDAMTVPKEFAKEDRFVFETDFEILGKEIIGDFLAKATESGALVVLFQLNQLKSIAFEAPKEMHKLVQQLDGQGQSLIIYLPEKLMYEFEERGCSLGISAVVPIAKKSQNEADAALVRVGSSSKEPAQKGGLLQTANANLNHILWEIAGVSGEAKNSHPLLVNEEFLGFQIELSNQEHLRLFVTPSFLKWINKKINPEADDEYFMDWGFEVLNMLQGRLRQFPEFKDLIVPGKGIAEMPALGKSCQHYAIVDGYKVGLSIEQ